MRVRTALPLILAFATPNALGAAVPDALLPDDFNSVFALTCMKHFHSQSKLPETLIGLGLEKLPTDQAEAFLEGQHGGAWIFVTPTTRYVVSLREDKVCAVFAQRANPVTIQSGFSALVGTAPAPLVAREEHDLGPNDEHTKTMGYSWSRPEDEAAMLFVLTTSDSDDAMS